MGKYFVSFVSSTGGRGSFGRIVCDLGNPLVDGRG
jgi:hypothetical protein